MYRTRRIDRPDTTGSGDWLGNLPPALGRLSYKKTALVENLLPDKLCYPLSKLSGENVKLTLLEFGY